MILWASGQSFLEQERDEHLDRPHDAEDKKGREEQRGQQPGGAHHEGETFAQVAPGARQTGADTTFNTALAQFTGFLEGSGGRIITVLSLAGGIVALASGRFSLGQVAIPVGVGVGAGTGIPIVTASVTGTV